MNEERTCPVRLVYLVVLMSMKFRLGVLGVGDRLVLLVQGLHTVF